VAHGREKHSSPAARAQAPRTGFAVLTHRGAAGTIIVMLGDALDSGLQLVGGWLDSGRTLAQRVRAQVVDPLVRLVGWPLTPSPAPPAAEQAPARPPSRVEEAKYYLAPTHEAPARYADRESGELPRSYGCDRITLLPRDPWWLFAHWEITPATRVNALRALGAEAEGAREILRVYDVTFITFTGDNAWQSFDVELPPGADRWYLNVGRPAASFCVEIGLATPGARFLPLARSPIATTPRATPSADTTARWVDLAAAGTPEVARTWDGAGPPRLESERAAAEIADGRPRSSDVHVPPPGR